MDLTTPPIQNTTPGSVTPQIRANEKEDNIPPKKSHTLAIVLGITIPLVVVSICTLIFANHVFIRTFNHVFYEHNEDLTRTDEEIDSIITSSIQDKYNLPSIVIEKETEALNEGFSGIAYHYRAKVTAGEYEGVEFNGIYSMNDATVSDNLFEKIAQEKADKYLYEKVATIVGECEFTVSPTLDHNIKREDWQKSGQEIADYHLVNLEIYLMPECPLNPNSALQLYAEQSSDLQHSDYKVIFHQFDYKKLKEDILNDM